MEQDHILNNIIIILITFSVILYTKLLTGNEIPFLFGSVSYIFLLGFTFGAWIMKEGLVDIR